MLNLVRARDQSVPVAVNPTHRINFEYRMYRSRDSDGLDRG
jgi:hypothetical protein